jgi:hypothetical protein
LAFLIMDHRDDAEVSRVAMATRATGAGHGGKRDGGGRPKGSRNKRSTLLIERAKKRRR